MANTSLWNDELYANFVSQAEFAAYEASVSRSLMKLFPIPMNAGKTVQVPIWGQGSAQRITNESAASARDTTSTSALITLEEHVYYSQVTDVLRDSAFGDVMGQVAEISGRAIGESLDTMAFSKFADLDAYADLGSTSTELTTELVLKGAARLRAAKVGGPYFCVVHPNAAFNMKKVLTQVLPYSGAAAGTIVNPSNLGNQVLVSGVIGSVGGVTIVESPLVAADTTGGATAYTCAVFAPTALGIAERGGLSMSTLYLPQNRATDISVVANAGAGVLQKAHGVKLTVEGTL
jgi:N4-gp56 family major capsid protein